MAHPVVNRAAAAKDIHLKSFILPSPGNAQSVSRVTLVAVSVDRYLLVSVVSWFLDDFVVSLADAYSYNSAAVLADVFIAGGYPNSFRTSWYPYFLCNVNG